MKHLLTILISLVLMSPSKAEGTFGTPVLEGELKYRLIMCTGKSEDNNDYPTFIDLYAFKPGFDFDKKVLIFGYEKTDSGPRQVYEDTGDYEIRGDGRYILIEYQHLFKYVTDDLDVIEFDTDYSVVLDNETLKFKVTQSEEHHDLSLTYTGTCIEHPDLETIDNPIKHF